MPRKTTVSMRALFIEKLTREIQQSWWMAEKSSIILWQKKKSRLKKNGCEMNMTTKLFSTSSTWIKPIIGLTFLKMLKYELRRRKWLEFVLLPNITGMYWTMTRWRRRFGARISRIAKGGNCLGFRISQRQMQQLIRSIKFNVLPQEEHQ